MERQIRKSAYGRTQLFLPDENVLMREVKCMGGMGTRDSASVYHVLPNAWEAKGAACWHCCEPIARQKEVVPLPRVYDAQQKVYYVYGRTCSPGCAKAYILEHTTFDRGQHLNMLTRMLHDLYGVEGAVAETPPRPALKRFGGCFDPRTIVRAECRLVQPPFVSYCMLAEEHVGGKQVALPTSAVVEEADTLDEPPPPALFHAFVAEQEKATPSSSSTSSSGKRKAEPTPRGPMSKFMK